MMLGLVAAGCAIISVVISESQQTLSKQKNIRRGCLKEKLGFIFCYFKILFFVANGD